MKLFQQIFVWKNISPKKSVRYVCFLDYETQKYCVQSADFFILPLKKDQLTENDNQLIALFTEISPIERCEWFNSITEAIKAHDSEFTNN